MTDILFRKPNHAIKTLAYILGFNSIIGQILLLRELIVVFYGNETAYAVILASWLFWIATGSFSMSRLTRRIKNPARMLLYLQLAACIILPVIIIITRSLGSIIGMQTGEAIGIIPMCAISYLLLAPLTFILGSIFTLICRLPSIEKDKESPISVGTIYLWEAKGAVLGGLIFSFVIIHFMLAINIAFLVGIISSGVIISLLGLKHKISKLNIGFIIIVLLAYISGGMSQLDKFTRKVQWRGFEVVSVTDSIYGNIVLTKWNNQYNLFENGLLSYSTKDELTSEENIHYSLLAHPDPKDVILIGNGIAGGLKEILKHSIERIDYVELDSKVIDISKRYLPKEVLSPLKDKRVNVIYTDARLLVKRTPKKYDVIIVNLGDPYTAMVNRYYSLEFFQEASGILRDGGIISLSVSSSENYLNKEAKTFLRSIHTTLKKVFPDVISIPGDANVFLACKDVGVLSYDPQVFIRRLKQRGIKTKYIEYYLPLKLSRDRVGYIKDVLKKEGAINTDMHPIAYLYDILLWSTRFSTTFKKIIESIQWVKLRHLMIFPILLFVVGLSLRQKLINLPVATSIVTTGFSEIVFQLVVVLAFQTLYGFAYYKIGLIMTSFMIGLALGSFVAQKIVIRPLPQIAKIYKLTQASICVYPLLLPGLFIVFRNATSTQNLGLFATTFALLPIIAGFIGGLQYPLATHLISSRGKRQEKERAIFAGALYAADTFGATIGALLTGTLLIPLLGITAVALLCAGINLAVFFLLLGDRYPARSSL